jgi:hypothetical protein
LWIPITIALAFLLLIGMLVSKRRAEPMAHTITPRPKISHPIVKPMPFAPERPSASIAVVTKDGDGLRIRAEPDGDVIGHASEGDRFEILATGGDWTKIKLSDDQSGWVSSKYIDIR